MSESSERGKSYEVKIQKLTARTLGLEVKRDPRSGAGDFHKADLRDRYGELPLSIECKNQETLKLKEWWRDADAKASVGQAPIVVFPMDTEDLAVIRYTDLLQIVKEAADYRAECEDLRKPQPIEDAEIPVSPRIPRTADEVKAQIDKVTAQRTPMKACPNGHLVPIGRDKCQTKGCRFSATYKAPKVKEKR